LKDLGIDWKIIFKFTLRKKHGTAWTDLVCFRREKSGGSCEHCNEPSGYMIS
jgi:hypothetical protein